MDGVSAIAASTAPVPPLRASSSAGVTAFNIASDQSSAQVAKAGADQATQQLESDQAPRGSPAAIASDHESVKLAEEAVQKASAKLQSDRSQTSFVDVLA